jgi:hypothetical protein
MSRDGPVTVLTLKFTLKYHVAGRILELRNLKLSHCVAKDSSSLACVAVVTDVPNDRVAFIFSTQLCALATLLPA